MHTRNSGQNLFGLLAAIMGHPEGIGFDAIFTHDIKHVCSDPNCPNPRCAEGWKKHLEVVGIHFIGKVPCIVGCSRMADLGMTNAQTDADLPVCKECAATTATVLGLTLNQLPLAHCAMCVPQARQPVDKPIPHWFVLCGGHNIQNNLTKD